MTRYVAFLRAINVGGRFVTMDRLQKQFEKLGFESVETFIASGNVIFQSKSKNALAIATQVEKGLSAALGYEVATFIRTDREVAAISEHEAFAATDIAAATAYVVGFLTSRLDKRATSALLALETSIDRFAVHGREIYWLCQRGQSASTFSNVLFERRLGVKSTFRNMTTITRLAAKHALT